MADLALGQDHRGDHGGPFRTCNSVNRGRTKPVTESERQKIRSKTSELTANTLQHISLLGHRTHYHRKTEVEC